ncbi:MAG: hypothetical protein AB1938_31115, partial [Myxococcota bacterium]
RLGAALLLVSGAGALSAALLSRTSVRTGLLLGLGAAVVFILASVTLPGLLHPADLERLESQLSFSPRALPPWPYFSLRDTRWPERLELLLAWPALLVGVWTAWTSPLLRLRVSALLAPLVVCVFPLWRTDVLDVGYRLALMAPAFAVPLLLLAAATWAQRGGEPRRRESQPSPGGAPEGQRASAAVPGPEDGGAARLDEAGQKSSGAVAPPAPSEGGCVRGDAPPEVARAAAKVATLGAGSMSHGEVPPEGTRAAAKVTTLGAESMSHGEVPPEGTRAAAKVATGGAGSMSRGDVPSERGSALGEESTASARAGALLPVRATALGLLLTALAARSGFDVSQTPPYAVWRTVIARIPRPLPALLIAPQGFNFLYDHETGHEALAWSPEASIDRTTTYRLVWGVTDGEWLEFAPDAEPPPERLGADVVYVREDVWEAFLARAQADGDAELLRRLSDWRNPLRVRPRSLVRNR